MAAVAERQAFAAGWPAAMAGQGAGSPAHPRLRQGCWPGPARAALQGRLRPGQAVPMGARTGSPQPAERRRRPTAEGHDRPPTAARRTAPQAAAPMAAANCQPPGRLSLRAARYSRHPTMGRGSLAPVTPWDFRPPTAARHRAHPGAPHPGRPPGAGQTGPAWRRRPPMAARPQHRPRAPHPGRPPCSGQTGPAWRRRPPTAARPGRGGGAAGCRPCPKTARYGLPRG
jgi:hypothetical protein